jgi:hypothetical protein
MAKDLGLQQDWREVTAMIKEELSVGGEARSAEDGIIATSLRAIKGPHAASARNLLKAFRLVPEDAKVPLEALAWICEASIAAEGGDGGTPSLLQLRRWTKLLIDRCLVLGPIDMPSLHDIVKDYADAQTEAAVSQRAHRRLVDLIRERRPGEYGWDVEYTDGRLSQYVLKFCGHHIGRGWLEDWAADEAALGWLDDYGVSQDAVPLACAQFLGTARVSQLAQRAERAGEWWSAAVRWSATGLHNRTMTGQAHAIPLLKSCAAALARWAPATPQQADAKDRLELLTVVTILLAWDPADVPLYQPRLEPLMETPAGVDEGLLPLTLPNLLYMESFSDEYHRALVYPHRPRARTSRPGSRQGETDRGFRGLT